MEEDGEWELTAVEERSREEVVLTGKPGKSNDFDRFSVEGRFAGECKAGLSRACLELPEDGEVSGVVGREDGGGHIYERGDIVFMPETD